MDSPLPVIQLDPTPPPASPSGRHGWRPGRRRGSSGWSIGLGLACWLGGPAAPALAATPSPPAAAPPQVLPLTARLCLVPATGSSGPPPTCIQLEEPRTPQQLAWGLQLRPPLPPLRGMWFAFQPPEPARFWMHRTPNPLDLVFVRDQRIVRIQKAAAPCMRLPCPIYSSDEPVDGVLEIAAGQAEALGLRVGGAVRIEPISRASR